MIVTAVDPALANFGLARFEFDLAQKKLMRVLDLKLVSTEKQSNKQVRVSSDDLRRATELRTEFVNFISGSRILFAEIPSGGQSARAALGFGVAIGILAGSPVPIIEVQPSETKLATVGTRTASKEEMIEWAVEVYPDAPWIKHMRAGKPVIGAKNEHLADACAIAHAGIKTVQFQQVIALLGGSSKVAA